MTEDAKLRPSRLSHIGIQTYDVPKTRDWYCAVLNAFVVYEIPGFCVIAYDEEHHRIAIAGLPGKPRRKFGANPEIMHVAFAMDNVFDLLANYERLRDLGIVPTYNMNHGPTLSSYYHDPDGNQCELTVDSFTTQEECQDWMRGPVYDHNHGGGVYFDPEELLAKMKAGATEKELLAYPVEEGMAVDMEDVAGAFMQQLLDERERFDAEVTQEAAAPAS